MSKTPSRRILILAACVALATAGAIVGIVRSSGDNSPAAQAEVERVHDASAALMAADYPRPAPDGGAPRPGVAADAYATAWERAAPLLAEDPEAEAALSDMWAHLWLPRGEPAGEPAPACAALEGSSAAMRARLAGVDPETCRAFVRGRGAAEALVEGSHRRDRRSPYDLWNAWMYPAPGQSRPSSVFRVAATLALIDAGLRLDPDAPEFAIDRTLAVLRFAADLHAGGTVLGAAVGSSLRIRATGVVRRLLDAHDLSPEALVRLRDGLMHVGRHEVRFGVAVQTEYVAVMTPYAAWLGAELPRTPGAVPVATEGVTTDEVRAAVEARGPTWARLMAAQREPLAERLAAYEQVGAELERGGGELDAALAGYDWAAYDRLVAQSLVHLDLVTIAAADHVHRHERGAWSTSLEALAEATTGLRTEDALTGGRYGLQTVEGERVVYSDAVQEAAASRLGLNPTEASRLAFATEPW